MPEKEVLISNTDKSTFDLLRDLKNELQSWWNIDNLKDKIRQRSKSDRLEILKEAEKQNSEAPNSQWSLYIEKVINAIVEVQKEKWEETNTNITTKDWINTLKSSIKADAYKKIENLNIFWLSISNLPDFFGDSLRAFVDKKTMSKEELETIEKEKLGQMDFMDKIMYNMEKWFMWFVWAGLFAYFWNQLPNLDEELNSVSSLKQVATSTLNQVTQEWEKKKKEIVETWEEVKGDVKNSWDDFAKKVEEGYSKEKEKLDLNPEVIYRWFISKYLDILIWSKGEKTKLMEDKYLDSIQNKTISDLKNDKNDLSKVISSEDSINLLTPFLSNNETINNILGKDYIKKAIQEDRLVKIKEEINKWNFDWEQIFTLQEISIIVPQKFTYIWSLWFSQVAKYLNTEQILSLDKDKIEEVWKELSDETKTDFKILKSSIFDEGGALSKLLDENQNDISFYQKESEENIEKRKVYEFTKSVFSSWFLPEFFSNIWVTNLTKDIKDKFNLWNMSKLYVLFNWKWEPNKWWDDQKITFVTWLTTQLSHQDLDWELWQLTSALLKTMAEDWENQFITNGMKKFFNSWGKLLWENYLRNNLWWPFNSIAWIIKNNLPDSISNALPWDITSKLPAWVFVTFWVLVMLYPAYRLTRVLTNPTVLASIVWCSLTYSWYKITQEPGILDKSVEWLKWLFKS